MKTKTITKNDFLEAVNSKQAILPAISALKKVDDRALSGNSYTANRAKQPVD
jgi:hypothetical protein